MKIFLIIRINMKRLPRSYPARSSIVVSISFVICINKFSIVFLVIRFYVYRFYA